VLHAKGGEKFLSSKDVFLQLFLELSETLCVLSMFLVVFELLLYVAYA
jgi:hypothetical protein